MSWGVRETLEVAARDGAMIWEAMLTAKPGLAQAFFWPCSGLKKALFRPEEGQPQCRPEEGLSLKFNAMLVYLNLD